LETRDPVQRLSKQRFLDVVPIQKADPSLATCVVNVVNKAMMLDPEYRYQSPAAMLADLRVTQRRLAEGPQESDEAAEAAGRQAAASAIPDTGRSVMVVESDAKMQDLLREGFRRAGYRVLVTVDPARALDRFRQDASVADCVIFNAQQIGLPALTTFNQLGEDQATSSIPAILLLEDNQQAWKAQARTAQHRIVLSMPVTLRQLRTLLAQLAPPKNPVADGST
jgi:serine/threonine-protein kinase